MVILITKDRKTSQNALKIGHLSTAYHSNFILMDSDEFRNNFNVDINWTLFGTGPAMVEAFNKGELDIGYMGLPPGIIGIDKGVPIKCIAGGHVEGTIMIGKRKYKSLQELKEKIEEVLNQFKGSAIGTPSVGSIHDAILNYYLEKYELKDEIEVKNYKQAEFIAIDMKKGILEAGVGTPALAVFAKTILDSHLIIQPNYLLPNNPSYGIFFHENLIKNEPELAKKFLEQHKRASFMLRNSMDEAAEIISQTFTILRNNKEYVKEILEISPKYCISLSEGYLNSTLGFVNTLLKLGYITKKLEIDEIFNFDIVNQVHPEKEHYTHI
jgi:NitT/TauT family transport system substrate-binding protein